MGNNVEQVLEIVDQMSIMEVCELVKTFEEKYGVSAQAAVAVAGPAAGGDTAAEEKTEFNVVMKSFGSNKIAVIKAIREVTSVGLKEAKDMADGAPSMIKEALGKDAAEEVKKKLEEAGATVTLK